MPFSRSLPVVLLAVALGACGSSSGSQGSSGSGAQTKTQTQTQTQSSAQAAAPVAQGSSVKATIVDFKYRPQTITVKQGTKITWTDKDTSNHTVTADKGSFDTGNISKGDAKSHTFTKAGSFTYHCEYHPFMHGRVVVK